MKRSFRSWLWRVDVRQEVDEEIAFHIEMRTRELVARGMDPKAAREVILARLGDISRLKRTCVDLGRRREQAMRMSQWLEELTQDVVFAARQLKRSPGFTLVATVTLALGIGANSAMFALADSTLLRPLPFGKPDRLVLVRERSATQLRSFIAPLSVPDWAAQNRTFEAMAIAFVSRGDGGPTLMANDGTPETVVGQRVTAGFFDVLGVRPIAGRTFLASDEANPDVAVLGEAFWRARFGGDLAVVGRDIALDGRPTTVIGIVASYFQTLQLPIVAGRSFSDRDTPQSGLVCIVNEAFARRYLAGRNPIGVRLMTAGIIGSVPREIVGVARQVKGMADESQDLAQIYVPNQQAPYPEAYLLVRPTRGRADALAPLVRAAIARVDREQPVRRVVTLAHVAREATARYWFRAGMVLTFAGLALLLALVGVFGVLAYSVQQRTREFGVRIALGATTGDVLRMVFFSAARLTSVGVLAGLALSLAFAHVISAFLFGVPPRDPFTLFAATVVLGVTAVAAALVPALRAARVDPVVAFRSE